MSSDPTDFTIRPRRLPVMIPMLLVTALLFASSGCRAPATVVEGPSGMPSDFSLDLTILTGGHVQTDQPQPHRQQSRYVLFPDGSLHYGADDRRGPEWLPPRTRQLNSRQVSNIWSLVEEISLAQREAGDEPINFKTLHAQPGHELYLLELSGWDHRWSMVSGGRFDQPQDPRLIRLVDALSELAWVSQDDPVIRPVPQRYNFGPDPYERYR